MDGTTAVVTGASRGIGAAVAREFAAAGARVVGCARDAEAMDEVADAIDAAGGAATSVRADVREPADVERLMEVATEVGGEIGVVVANAGINPGPAESPLPAEPYDRFDDLLATNVRGVFATVREAAPHLAADARVLVPSGKVAREPTPGAGAYAVSKAGAEALARGFAADLEAAVGVVDPGLVATDLAGGRGRDPEAVAPMFRWAAAEVPAADLDGQVLGLREWRSATRDR